MDHVPLGPNQGIDAQIITDRQRRTYVLLSGGGRLGVSLRRWICQRLTAKGYNTVILEDFPGPRGESVKNKWARFVGHHKPDGYMVIVQRRVGSLSSMSFELGTIYATRTDNCVSFFLESGLEGAKVLRAYLQEAQSEAHTVFYASRQQLARRIGRRIDNLSLREHG